MKNILLIGNLDGQSPYLLRYATKFCKDYGLKLHILQIEPNNSSFILSSPHYFNKFGFIPNQDKSIKKKELESFVSSNTKDIIDTQWISFKIVEGNIEDCLEKFTNEHQIDLIITRKTFIRDIKIEQNEIFSRILTNVSETPMLIVPENELYKRIRKIAFFTTFSDDDFKNINWFSKNFESASIELIHSSMEEDNMKNKKWVDYLKSEVSSKIQYKHIINDFKDYIDASVNGIDPTYDGIVLTTHKRKFWKRIIETNTTISIVSNIEVPVLIFKSTNNVKN